MSELKVKKSKKGKRKIRLNNYSSTSNWIIGSIYIFRILAICSLVITPIYFSLVVTFDTGVNKLILYMISTMGRRMKEFISGGKWMGSNPYNSIGNWLPIVIWLLTACICFLFFFVPFLRRRTRVARGMLSFRYFFWSILLIATIHLLPLLFPFFAHGKNPGIGHDPNDATTLFWFDLVKNWKPFGFWMLTLQIFHLTTIAFAIFAAIEADWIKRGKLKYEDLIYRDEELSSLVNGVLDGKLNFGEFDDKNLKLEIKRLRGKLIIDDEIIKKIEDNHSLEKVNDNKDI